MRTSSGEGSVLILLVTAAVLVAAVAGCCALGAGLLCGWGLALIAISLLSAFFGGVISFKRYAERYRETRRCDVRLANGKQSLEAEVRERTEAIRNLLDYAGQGFLSIDEQLTVQPEYSGECRRLLGRDIAGLSFPELICPHDPAERALLEDMLRSVFDGDRLRRDVCLSLLPEEVEVQGASVALQYKWIWSGEAADKLGRVMVVMTDISERRRMERMVDREKQVLRMVVWVIKHGRDFKEMIAEYRAFALDGLGALLRSPLPVADQWVELSRTVHTFKGNFAQIDFVHTVDKLHAFEFELSDWKERIADAADPEAGTSLRERLLSIDLLAWLEEDLGVLRDVLGEQYDVGQEVVAIERERLRGLERQVLAMLPGPEAKAIVSELKKLHYRPFRELLGHYPDYAAKLAEQTGKELRPIRVVGGDEPIDPELYGEFARTLVHVFRNMVDHGIEPPEERISVGKDRRGTIRCVLGETGEGVVLHLSNDGREMRGETIKLQAVERGLCTLREADGMSEDELRLLIFCDGFTTRATIGGLSGRGVGLAAVRRALDKLNGTVRVDSGAEFGTAFTFVIPRAGRTG